MQFVIRCLAVYCLTQISSAIEYHFFCGIVSSSVIFCFGFLPVKDPVVQPCRFRFMIVFKIVMLWPFKKCRCQINGFRHFPFVYIRRSWYPLPDGQDTRKRLETLTGA